MPTIHFPQRESMYYVKEDISLLVYDPKRRFVKDQIIALKTVVLPKNTVLTVLNVIFRNHARAKKFPYNNFMDMSYNDEKNQKQIVKVDISQSIPKMYQMTNGL